MIKSAIISLFLFFSGVAYGAQSGVDFVIPDKVYVADKYQFTSASLANESTFRLSLDRTYWTDPTTTLTILAEISTDNGQSYALRYAATSKGGPPNNELTELVFMNSLAGTRRIRFTLTLNKDLRTSGIFHAE